LSDSFESLFCSVTEQQVYQMKLEYVKFITNDGSIPLCNM